MFVEMFSGQNPLSIFNFELEFAVLRFPITISKDVNPKDKYK